MATLRSLRLLNDELVRGERLSDRDSIDVRRVQAHYVYVLASVVNFFSHAIYPTLLQETVSARCSQRQSLHGRDC